MQMTVDDNLKDFTKWLSRQQKRHLPKALAKTLTYTAQDAQAEIIEGIQSRFNNRKKWWVKGSPVGVKVDGANVKAGKYESRVYTNAYFGELQEEGGVKIPYKGKGFLIPTEMTPAYGRQSGGSKRLLKTKKILRYGGKATGSPIWTMNSGKRGVFRRRGDKRLPLDLMYNYRGAAVIRPRMRFVKTAQSYAEKHFLKKFIRIAKYEMRRR